MKKRYIQPRVKEVKIESHVMTAGSIDIGMGNEPIGGGNAHGKTDWDFFGDDREGDDNFGW